MMLVRNLLRSCRAMVTCCAGAVLVAGCGGGRNGLPNEVDVQLPDGTTQQTTLGSGVISFADSTWEFFQAGPTMQGSRFLTIRFGPEGQLEAFENNTIASNIFGTTILFDGERHATTQPGLQYAAATYGAQTADARGFAFEGRLAAFVTLLQAADAVATAAGEFESDGIDTIRGTFTFSSRVTLVDIPSGNVDMEINFVGHRVDD